ncbi:non-motile and phage-resistance protein [bacterium BMS3Abin03]|nr:non-motile and phage-resistance protein [bacterium BMS3Abin03]
MIKTNILIVEDEIIVAKNIEKKLTVLGYNVLGNAATGAEAVNMVRTKKPDLVLMDIKLKGEMDGIETANLINKSRRLPLIYLTSYPDDETFQRAKATEPFGYLIKPFDTKELQRTIEIALYKHKLNNDLLETKQRYERAVEAGNTAVWEIRIDELKFITDKSFVNLSGYSHLDLGNNFEEWINIVHDDDKEQALRITDEIRTGKISDINYECRIIRKDGQERWIINRGTVLPPDGNFPKRIIGTSTDITQRKLSEIALAESEERFRTIFENSGIGMAILSPKLRFIKVNKSFADLFGYIPEELLNLNMVDVTHPSDRKRSIKIAQDLLQNDSKLSVQVEKKYIKKNGDSFWGLVTITPIKYSPEKITYTVAQLFDITKRKTAEMKLVKYAEELKELNSSKDKFFSIISHDLRSPFNALLGIAEYTTQYADDMTKDEIKDSVTNIYRSTKKVYNFLDNLLEWTQLQTGRLQVERSNMNLSDLADVVINLYNETGSNKGITLVNNIPDNIDVFADHYMIETVFRNLVSNGIKFSFRNGKVIIEASKKDDYAEVTISDNGIGISPENQGKLFRIDDQFKSVGTENEKGTGLGLILCKELIEKNGGSITIRSEEGKGSSFIFTIPLSRSDIL